MTFFSVCPTRSIAANFSEQEQTPPSDPVALGRRDQFLARISDVQNSWDIAERESRKRIASKRLQMLKDLIT